ncbi:hypothetical protein GF377_04445 [candidate division GN15 bacterium]|nr:hypothetical protein [candidate division GN15 bacterium]
MPRMKQDVLRLERLMDNVLRAVRLQNAPASDQRELVDVSKLLHRVVDRFERIPSTIPVNLTREIDERINVHGDEVALEGAFDALLDNAFKYHDGDKISITVRVMLSNDKVRVEIEDQGAGIDRRELESVFERFYRVGSELTRAASGTGLGLYIVRETIRAHDGEVVAESDGSGRGARFVVTLPAAADKG